MLINFIYKLPASLVPLTRKEMIGFTDDRIVGWFDQADVSQLKHCSMFMVCNYEQNSNVTVYTDPVGIVARNEVQALEIYHKATNMVNGLVFCSIIDDCSNITVEI